ncbi:MAG: DUF488 family protein [Candidatus ainarchaeum sp.]|nr:DUF488 family protein [Candidatus ainarchaeum sp.]
MIYRRQKLLLQIIKRLSEKGISSKTYLVKAIFLLRQKLGFEKVAYDFFPYKHGPFSNEIYKDFNFFEAQGLFDEEKLSLTEQGEEFVKTIETNETVLSGLEKIVSEYSNLNALIGFVYEKYPEFTVKSEKIQRKEQSGNGIYSIGYEGKTIDCFLNQLIQNKISLLVDVRKNAFSMKKSFSKKSLENYLKNAGIGYLHLPGFGVDSEKRKKLETKQDYANLFADYKKNLDSKKTEIIMLEGLGKKQKIALMCFEANKDYCHRGVLSDFLNQEVVHI